jgi:ISXO2-like transposase domain
MALVEAAEALERNRAVTVGNPALPASALQSRTPEPLDADSLLPVIKELIEPGSVVSTDGHLGYEPLAAVGYTHDRRSIQASGDPGHIAMPRVHRVSSLLKRWLLGTHQGAVRPQQLCASEPPIS